jgi:hypothetical protein
VAVSADTLPTELQLLKEGYVAALVGQRPFEMEEKTMDTLLALHESKPVQEIIYTGVDRVTKDKCRRVPQIARRDQLLAAFRLLAVLGYTAPPRCLRVAAISPGFKANLPSLGTNY